MKKVSPISRCGDKRLANNIFFACCASSPRQKVLMSGVTPYSIHEISRAFLRITFLAHRSASRIESVLLICSRGVGQDVSCDQASGYAPQSGRRAECPRAGLAAPMNNIKNPDTCEALIPRLHLSGGRHLAGQMTGLSRPRPVLFEPLTNSHSLGEKLVSTALRGKG